MGRALDLLSVNPESGEQLRGELAYAARAQGQYEVARLGRLRNLGNCGRKIRFELRLRVAHARYKKFGIDARNRFFARGVNRQHGYSVGECERGAEFAEEIASACVAVGLEDDVNLVVSTVARGCE